MSHIFLDRFLMVSIALNLFTAAAIPPNNMDTDWSISGVKEYYSEWQQACIIVYLLTSVVFTIELVLRLYLQGAWKFFTGHFEDCQVVRIYPTTVLRWCPHIPHSAGGVSPY